MEPIINPIWFYIMDVVFGMKLVAGGVCCISFVTAVIFVVLKNDAYNAEEIESFGKLFKKSAIGLVLSSIVLVTVPNSSTIEKMIIAKNITPNNIELFGDTVKDGVDYVFEKINSLDKGE